MPVATQKGRLLSLDTPLGPDKLLLDAFSGREAISELFHFELELSSEDADIKFEDIIGKNVTVRIKLADGATDRYLNGVVSRFLLLPGSGRVHRYKAEVVPWLWYLTRTADCRIFQEKSVPDIVKSIFDRLGFRNYELQLTGTYDPWDYCVQYRETALNFVQRLLEQEGIFYFFRHEETKHTLILADNRSVHKPCPHQHQFRYDPVTGSGYAADEDAVHSWRLEKEIRPGKFAYTDYNFETPSTSLMSNVDSHVDLGGNRNFEIYDYPGEYEKKDHGAGWVRTRMEEQEAAHSVITGEGNARAMVSGYKFDLTNHDRRDQNGTFILTGIVHHGAEPGWYSGAEGEEALYRNSFTCIPDSIPFRPQRSSPKPVVHGAQTAVVTGPSGEEIYTDKYGRVKVQFHWDREGKRDEKSSCWVRVAQPWAGKQWGGVILPRIGQEVIVDFLEGDADRPIITGRVYNAENMPPYKLPDHSTVTTMQTRSSKGGGSSNYNEIRMEDKKGQEQIYIQAENEMDVYVKGDSRESVGRDKHLTVGRHRLESIAEESHVNIGKDHLENIGLNLSLSVGQNVHETAGQNFALEAGQAIHLKAGMKVVIEAGAQLSLKAAGGFIDIGPAGVTIQGTLVRINSGGSAGSGSGASPKQPKKPDKADNGSCFGKS